MKFTPSALILRAYLLLCILTFVLSWLHGLFSLANPSADYLRTDIDGQLRSVERRMNEGGALWQGQFQPEGKLFSYGFYCMALINVASVHRDDQRLISETLKKLELLLPKLEACEQEYPFTVCTELRPTGGVIAAGVCNLVRAGYILIGGNDAKIISSFHKRSSEISEAYSKSALPFLESFPGLRWPVDNCCAIESLRYHDLLFSTDYARLPAERWQDWLLANQNIYDGVGMMIAQVGEKGEILDVPRGCALSWTLAFTPGFAPKLDQLQYQNFRTHWFIPVLGTVGIREWNRGQEKYSKISEGPVIYDIGAAASGLGIAATHVHRDQDHFIGLIRGLESIGFPTWNLQGEKSYFGQLFLLGDILAVWGKTCTVWDEPATGTAGVGSSDRLQAFFLPLGLASFIGLLCLSASSLYFFQGIKKFRLSQPSLDKHDWRFASFAMTAIIANLLIPAFLWVWCFVVLGLILWLEKWNATINKFKNESSN